MTQSTPRPRLLIEDWLPIAALGIESVRERTPMTPFPAPNRIHVWWARRPLVASRAAVLASILPADADREMFMQVLGIHGDPVEAQRRIEQATRDGIRLGKAAYGYDRAFSYLPAPGEQQWVRDLTEKVTGDSAPVVLDPTAGGGSIPMEALRLGLPVIANELNPVAWLVLKCTIEYPARFGRSVLERYNQLASQFRKRACERLEEFYPKEPGQDCIPDGYLWARTITCPYCAGLVPLSPNWRLSSKGHGVRLVPHTGDPDHRHCAFEVVTRAQDQSEGTVKGGDGLCPYPDCGRVIDGDEIKAQAQAGRMGQQLYAVVYKQKVVVGHTKTGKEKVKAERGFRAPRPADDVSEQVQAALDAKLPEWQARNIVPDEERYIGPADRSANYGMITHVDLYSTRQLYGHCTSVEVFQELVEELRERGGNLSDVDRAALSYVALALDKMLNYNAMMVRWHANREVVAGVFDRHDFSFKWSFAELAPTITGVGYDWALKQTGKALRELVDLVGHHDEADTLFSAAGNNGRIDIRCGSGDALDLDDAGVDCVVMDPPYYDNVMYAELADFFYVWLKRTAGLLYPDAFTDYLTDKDREAVANPARFKGQKKPRERAARDYHERMAALFAECRRVLRPHGVMTVMFTHKSSGAWDALAGALVKAGFTITASWPVNTEAEGSMHIKEKSAAKSTIFLVCRVREERDAEEAVYWEDVEPLVGRAVRERVAEFQQAGIAGVDLYLASFGPALQVFSEHWPLQRGRAAQRPPDFDGEWDPYAVRPEDALDAARREVKQWRMAQLATVQRRHHLDPLTEWFVLAWDAFRAPRFPADEALKLARVVGLDFDRDCKNRVCEAKGQDVILWDSLTRKRKGRLGAVGAEHMLDTLHQAAATARETHTGAARTLIEDAGLHDDPTLLTALEALLNVLPPAGAGAGKKEDPSLAGATSDFDALEKLRRLAFVEQVPEPKQELLF